jgi:DNA-binding NtrC family response regulator
VGSTTPVPVDVRIVAGTHRDLDALAGRGQFRADLLYRLCVMTVVVPPLRARRQDILPLAESFLQGLAARRHRVPPELAPEAREALLEHAWPGNVRELKHVVEAAALTCEGEEIRAADLRIEKDLFRKKARDVASLAGEGQGLRQTLSSIERERLVAVLGQHAGNQSATAKALGLTRQALRRRLERYGLL